MAELTLDADGERALREAENLCWRANVAILAPEHLLGGALIALASRGAPGLPAAERVQHAVTAVQGMGSEPLTDNVMWGSAARDALSFAAVAVRDGGASVIDARAIALGLIASGEVNPMFWSALGVGRDELARALG